MSELVQEHKLLALNDLKENGRLMTDRDKELFASKLVDIVLTASALGIITPLSITLWVTW